MLENIKLLLGIATDEKDRLLNLLIEQATQEAQDFTNCRDTSNLSSTIERMVVFNYNRLGTEGVEGEGYSGVSYSYSATYPDNIMNVLKRHRKLKTL